MAVSELIGRLFKRQSEVRQQAVKGWRDFVVAAADGKISNETEIITWLADHGRTVQELADAIEQLRARRELAKSCSVETDLSQQLRSISQQVTDTQASNERTIRQLEDKLAGLRNYQSRLIGQIESCRRARDDLKATAGKSLLLEIENAGELLRSSQGQLAEAERQLEGHEAELVRRRGLGQRDHQSIAFMEELERMAEQSRAAVARLRNEAEQHATALAGLEARLLDPAEFF